MLLTALACALAAAALTRCMRSVAEIESRWLGSGIHIVLAAAGGGGAAALAPTWVELVAFAALAVACALLVTIDLAAYRLPDVIVGPMYPVLFLALAIAAAVSDDWGTLGRAAAASAVLLAGYFTLAFINPSGLGMGDVKLSGLLGAFLGWLGWPAVLTGTLAAFALNGVLALVLLLTTRATRRSGIPFGPAMVAGAAIGAWLSTGA